MCAAASGRVFLFSGHMIDAPGRVDPRFPPQLESAIAKAIHDKLDQLQCAPAGHRDQQRCMRRRHPVRRGSTGPGPEAKNALAGRRENLYRKIGRHCRRRLAQSFFVLWLRERSNSSLPSYSARLGDNEDPFERTNRWMLDEALRIGGAGACLICVWDGQGGDGPGGTKHMVETVLKRGGQFHWVDIRRL